MRLHSIDYTEFSDRPYRWSLEDLTLIDINLLVGRNAVGKTRIMRVINGLARLIEGNVQPNSLSTGYYKAVFQDDRESPRAPDVTYEIEISNNKVKKEVLTVGNEKKLERNESGRGSLRFEKLGEDVEIQVPEISLAAASRRDAIQHSFFETLHTWANTVRHCEFAKAQQDHASVIDRNLKWETVRRGPVYDDFLLLFKLGKERYGRDLTGPILSNMRKIGYELTEVGITPVQGIRSPIPATNIPEILYVREQGIDKDLRQSELSAGMFRALVILIQLQMIQLEKTPSCVLIDDIGEGMDFDRATKLISIVIDMAQRGYSQFVMATNDRFVMNKVPLEYWCVIEREGGKVQTYTPRNAPERFKEFEEYGFSNFDFFAKGFFSRSIKDD